MQFRSRGSRRRLSIASPDGGDRDRLPPEIAFRIEPFGGTQLSWVPMYWATVETGHGMSVCSGRPDYRVHSSGT
jgi:hypothetical protein